MTGLRHYVGIDPDLNGAIAIVAINEGGRVEECKIHPMPTLRSGPKGRREINVRDICWTIENIHYQYGGSVVCACVEHTTGSAGWGASACFTLGYTRGVVVAALTCACIPHILARPQKWQKHFGIYGRGLSRSARKQRALSIVQSLIPGEVKNLTTQTADAVLLALYARQQMEQEV